MTSDAGGRYLATGGFETHLHEHGSGAAVVMLHGSGPGVSAWENWSGNMTGMGEGRHAIAPDLAGFGETRIDAKAKLDNVVWCRQVIDLLDAMGKEKVVLIGNSLGGYLTIQLALEHPDRVAGIILMGTPGGEFDVTEPLMFLRNYEPSLENMRKMLRMFPANPDFVTEEMVAIRHARSLKSHGGTRMRLRSEEEEDEAPPTRVHGTPFDVLAKIKVPALIVHGAMDRVLPPSIAVDVHRAIPGSSLVIYGGTGHWAQSEKRDWFNRDARAFMDDIGWGRA